MVNKKSKSNKSAMSQFSRAYTSRALKSIVTRDTKTKAAAERLAQMRVGDKYRYYDEASEDEQNEIERISLNKAVQDMQAKLAATRNYSGERRARFIGPDSLDRDVTDWR